MDSKIHLWQGEWINSSDLALRVEKLSELAAKTYSFDFPLIQFIDVCDRLGKQLAAKEQVYVDLVSIALEHTKMAPHEIESMFGVITGFLNKEAMVKKLKNELHTDDPFEISRLNFKEHQFEGYAPLGLLVHVAPSNVFTVSVLCIIEGLLTGNLNFLKTSGSDSLLPQHFFKKLIDLDETGRLKDFIIIARVSSKSADLLKKILSYADGISAWGSEEAIKSLSQMAPDGAKVIKWGHKISFGYICKEYLNNERELTEMAKDVCRIEQQACSSPQNIYVEVSSFEELVSFAKRFSSILYKVSSEIPITEPESNFQAEITNTVEVVKAEESLNLTKVFEAEDKSVRILVDSRKALRASPYSERCG